MRKITARTCKSKIYIRSPMHQTLHLLLVLRGADEAKGSLPDGLEGAVARVDPEDVVHDGVGGAGGWGIRIARALAAASLASLLVSLMLMLMLERSISISAVSADHD